VLGPRSMDAGIALVAEEIIDLFARRSRVSVSTNVTPTPDNERLAYFHVIVIHRGLARHVASVAILENLIALRVNLSNCCLWRSFIRLRREAIAGFKAVDFDQDHVFALAFAPLTFQETNFPTIIHG